MAGVNKVILVGHLGKDPEVRTSQNGTKIVSFSLATSVSWYDRATGERRDRTEWHRIVIFSEQPASVAERFLRKGSKAYLEGSLQTRKWTGQDGQEHTTTEIIVDQVVLLDSRTQSPEHSSYENTSRGDYNTTPATSHTTTPPALPQRRNNIPPSTSWDTSPPSHTDIDDEIPF